MDGTNFVALKEDFVNSVQLLFLLVGVVSFIVLWLLPRLMGNTQKTAALVVAGIALGAAFGIVIGLYLDYEHDPFYVAAHPSISLTTPYQSSGPNQTTVNAGLSASMDICGSQRFQTITISSYFVTGETLNGSGNVISIPVGNYAPVSPVVTQVNTVTGAWTATFNGQTITYGTLTGASLTGAQSWLTQLPSPTMQNQIETAFSSAPLNILPGTTIPWYVP